MEVSFKAEVVLTIEVLGTKTNHVATEFNLIPENEMQKKQFLDAEGYPNPAGTKVLSNILVQGLIGNIHAAHENAIRDSAEHLRWIISELERGFATVAYVEKTDFKK